MKRILICDDEPHILEGLRYLLRGPQRTIQVARNGREAIECIEREVPDLLITDVMMPEMSGLEVVARLQTHPQTRDLPIIILTAKGQAQDAAMAQEVWGALVIAKPFEPQKLKEVVSLTLASGRCPQASFTY
jgi:CheY-like chemotaxis protein